MVDQKIFKTAKRYGFDSVYFDKSSIDAKYITYIRPLLTPTCEYVLVNPNGKQFQKLTNLLSVLVFEAIGKYIHPTRYRQIIETQSCEVLKLLPNEQKWISEDQKHSSNPARVHYQKKRSREVAMRGRWCMQKLLQESKNVEYENEENEGTPVRENDIPQPHPTSHADKLPTRRSGVRFTCEEDNYLRFGIEKFGLRWFCTIQISILTNAVLQIL